MRPNILVIMTEQHRADCLGIEGHPCLLTPNMDSIGAGGTRFTRAYTTCPTCIAARRSFLTGQFPSPHGMVGYRDGVPWENPPTTIAGALTQEGYQTAWIGRSMHQVPTRRRFGFEQIVTHEEYMQWLDRDQLEGSGGYFGGGPMHNDWTARPWHMEERFHSTNWITNQALRFLEQRDPSCPFFAVVSYYAAHPPLTPPDFYMDRYLRAEIPDPIIGDWASPPDESWHRTGAGGQVVNLQGEALRSCRAGYYGLINHVDDQLRRILNPVDGIQRATGDNTVVCFVSDHGEMLGDHYRYHKIMPYESSARIPFMISTPARMHLQTGGVCSAAVCLEDLMPTLLEIADADIPSTVEGRSLLPLLRGEETLDRDYLHIEHAPAHQSLTDGKEKFIWFVADGREQFFDLREDPQELHDLIESPDRAARIDLWRRRLIEELRDRPEGFTDGEHLIPGRPYQALLERH